MPAISPTQPMASPAIQEWSPSLDSLHRFTIEQYEAMVASGAFKKEDRLELIEGSLVEKTTKGPNHSTGSEDCWRAIHALLAAGWHVRIEKPIRIPDRDSEPEPDVSVARGKTATTAGAIPAPPRSVWSSRWPIRASKTIAPWP